LIRLDRRDPEPATEGEEEAAPVLSPDAAETTRLIERLLRKGVSDSLRDDLTEMKQQLVEGTLGDDDRRYVRSLAKRLGV
jgi:hypothetical protein